jgi:hypothetical protein
LPESALTHDPPAESQQGWPEVDGKNRAAAFEFVPTSSGIAAQSLLSFAMGIVPPSTNNGAEQSAPFSVGR